MNIPSAPAQPPDEKARAQMAALAASLRKRRAANLEAWRRATAQDPQLSFAARLSRAAFYDHLPDALDALDHALCAWPDPGNNEERSDPHGEQQAGLKHGRHRWQQGYGLRDIVREWGLLNERMVAELDRYERHTTDLHEAVLPAARLIAARWFCEGISESVAQYQHLHQAEAAGRVADLEQALCQMRAAQTERGQALRVASHDLRGSLALVQGATTLLDEKRLDTARRRELLRLVQNGVAALSRMLTDLLDLARLEAGQEQRVIQELDAAHLLRDFCASSRPLAKERRLYLRTRGPETLPVEGDPLKLQRILQNLLLNALKYSREGGVTVTWEICDDEHWAFSVRDTGPGLSAGAAPMATALAEATAAAPETSVTETNGEATPDRQAGGEGIGLSIVRRLCVLLDAVLEVETSERGSTFRVLLPRRYRTARE